MDGLWYLPDFWLPDFQSWIEIKGVYPNDEEELKAKRLLHVDGYPVFILYGNIESLSDKQYGLGYVAKRVGTLIVKVPRVNSYWAACRRCKLPVLYAETSGIVLRDGVSMPSSMCKCIVERKPASWLTLNETSSAFYEAKYHRFFEQGPYIPGRFRRRSR